MKKLTTLTGTEVQIYPGDSDSKYGIIEEVSNLGILFKITKSRDKSYTVGSLHFIGVGSKLSFKTV